MTTRRSARFALALLISTAATALWALPVVTHLNSRVLGGPSDATSGIRDYWYAEHVGKTPFSVEHDSLIAAPEGLDLSPSIQAANAFQPAVVWSLKDLVGLVAAVNLFLLAGIVLSASCMWLLLDWLELGAPAAVFGAFAYAASGFIVDKAFAGHAGLVHAWVFPLVVLAVLRRRRGAPHALRFAALAGAIVGVAFYVHSYYGAFALFLLVVLHVVEAVRETSRVRASLTSLVVGLGTMVATLLPALVARRTLATAPGAASHPVAALQQFGARVEAYVSPAQWTPLGHLVPQGLRARLDLSGEPSLFFGFSTLALAVVYVTRLRRRSDGPGDERFVAVCALTLVTVAFVMSLPRLFSIGPIDLPMPSWFIAHVSTTIRVYARFGVLVGLGLAVLAALAVSRLHRTKGARWAIACVAVLVIELTPTLPASSWATNRVPAADRWLAAHPGGTVAIYPLVGDEPAAARLEVREYYFQRFHGHPLFSAIVPSMSKVALALHEACQYFTDKDTATILATEGVRYVVLREDVYREIGQPTPTPPASDFRFVARVADARIYRVTAKPVDRTAFIRSHGVRLAAAIGLQAPSDHFDSGFYGPETYQFATPWRWMSQNAAITVDVPESATELQFETFAFSNRDARTLQLHGPDGKLLGTASVATSLAPITIGPFPVHAGRATFRLTASPGPAQLSEADPRVTSVYLNEPVFRPLLTSG